MSLERFKLFNADCFAVLPQLADESIDLVLTDLPYGTTACKWDSVLPLEELWKELLRVAKKNAALVFTAQHAPAQAS